MDFLTRQKKLQAEAKMALAMAKPMAKMQVEVEKQNRKKSPVADLVSGGRGTARGGNTSPFAVCFCLSSHGHQLAALARGACRHAAVEIGTRCQDLKGRHGSFYRGVTGAGGMQGMR